MGAGRKDGALGWIGWQWHVVKCWIRDLFDRSRAE